MGRRATAMLCDVLVTLVSPLPSPLSPSLSLSLSPFYNRWEITAENGALNFPTLSLPITLRRRRRSPRSLGGMAGWLAGRGRQTCPAPRRGCGL